MFAMPCDAKAKIVLALSPLIAIVMLFCCTKDGANHGSFQCRTRNMQRYFKTDFTHWSLWNGDFLAGFQSSDVSIRDAQLSEGRSWRRGAQAEKEVSASVPQSASVLDLSCHDISCSCYPWEKIDVIVCTLCPVVVPYFDHPSLGGALHGQTMTNHDKPVRFIHFHIFNSSACVSFVFICSGLILASILASECSHGLDSLMYTWMYAITK